MGEPGFAFGYKVLGKHKKLGYTDGAMSTERKESPDPGAPVQLHARAMDNLAFIREAMTRSSSFTSVPGRGLLAMGLLALAGSFWASRPGAPWLGTWLAVAGGSVTVGAVSMTLKARRNRESLWMGPGRRFALSLAPPIVAGALLTAVFVHEGLWRLLPPLWLLLYGAGCVTGGAFSVRVVPLMGMCFMALAGGLMSLPEYGAFDVAGGMTAGDLFLAAGFGGLHIVFGVVIALRHGG